MPKRHLPYSSDPLLASDEARSAAGSLEYLGTTASDRELLAKRRDPRHDAVGFVTLVTEPSAAQAELIEAKHAQTVEEETARRRWMVDPPEPPEWAKDPEWAADMEHVWAVRVREDIERLEKRAKRLRRLAVHDGAGIVPTDGERVALLRSAEWCENRARSAALTRRDLVDTCGGRWRVTACACGPREVQVGCEQTTLCESCRKRHWKKWRRRLVRAMDPHLRAAVDLWSRRGRRGPRPGIYLLTLTAPHSGDLVTDRRTLGDAWRSISKRASYGGYQLGERYSERKWWGHHALVYEATSGTKHDGHMHAHVACISQWVPYRELRDAWAGEIPGAVIVDCQSPIDAQRKATARGRRTDAVSNAAQYLAKYVTKGVEPTELTGRKAGELLIAMRGRRKVTVSRGFWEPTRDREHRCRTCGQMHVMKEAPISLQEHAPAAVFASLVARSRWRPPTGQPRLAL